MNPAIITLEDHVSGDTWQGIALIGPVQIQSGESLANFPYPVASARLGFARAGGGRTPLSLASTGTPDGPITILDEDTWLLSIPPVAPSVWTPEPGKYLGHFEVTDFEDTIITLYEIRLTVLADKP